MKTKLTSILSALAMCASALHAQNDECLKLIPLSRTVQSTLVNETEFHDVKNHFCTEYEKSRAQKRSANYGGSWDILSVSMGTSSRTADNVASKYCRFDGDTRDNEATFRQYISGVAPEAYEAFQACTAARRTGVIFDLLSRTQNELELRAFHRSTTSGAVATLSWSSSDPVNCSWLGSADDGSAELTLQANEGRLLECRRPDPRVGPTDEADFVNIFRQGAEATLSIPWPKYTPAGQPIPTVQEVRDQVERDIAEMAASLTEMRDQTGNLTSALNSFRSLSRLPLQTRIDADPGYWGTWRDEFFCPDRYYVCGLQQRIEGRQGGGSGDDTAMNGLRMFCCPLFSTEGTEAGAEQATGTQRATEPPH